MGAPLELSETALNELDKLGNGDTCVKHMRTSAQAACSDGATAQGCRQMGRLHCEQQLHKWLENSPLAGENIEFYDLRLTLQMRTEDTPHPMLVPCLLPRLLFYKLYTWGHDRFRASMLGKVGGVGGCRIHWENLFADPEVAASHPMSIKPELREKIDYALPLNLHMDGAVMLRSFELDIFSFSSSFTRGCSWDCKLLSLLLPHECLVDGITHGEIAGFWAEEFCIFQTGIFPTVDRYLNPFPPGSLLAELAGKELAGGWIASFSGTKCDNKAKVEANEFRKPFARNYGCTFICEHDAAVQGGEHGSLLSYCRCGASAPWKMTRMTTDTYLRATRDCGKPYPFIKFITLPGPCDNTIFAVVTDIAETWLRNFVAYIYIYICMYV